MGQGPGLGPRVPLAVVMRRAVARGRGSGVSGQLLVSTPPGRRADVRSGRSPPTHGRSVSFGSNGRPITSSAASPWSRSKSYITRAVHRHLAFHGPNLSTRATMPPSRRGSSRYRGGRPASPKRVTAAGSGWRYVVHRARTNAVQIRTTSPAWAGRPRRGGAGRITRDTSTRSDRSRSGAVRTTGADAGSRSAPMWRGRRPPGSIRVRERSFGRWKVRVQRSGITRSGATRSSMISSWSHTRRKTTPRSGTGRCHRGRTRRGRRRRGRGQRPPPWTAG